MPIYNFLCDECGEEFEAIYFSWNDDTSKQKCKKCSKIARKVPSVNAHNKANWSQWNSMG